MRCAVWLLFEIVAGRGSGRLLFQIKGTVHTAQGEIFVKNLKKRPSELSINTNILENFAHTVFTYQGAPGVVAQWERALQAPIPCSIGSMSILSKVQL